MRSITSSVSPLILSLLILCSNCSGMANLLGHVGVFDPAVDNWSNYTEQLGQYFIANDLTDNIDKQKAVLLSSIGNKAYSLLRDICAPALPADKTYVQLVKSFKDYLNPKPSVICERFRFNKCEQAKSESIAQFITNFNRLAEHCDFNAFRKDALRDRFVCGLRDLNIQKRLLSVKDLTWEKATEQAISLELADLNAVEFKPSFTALSTNKVKSSKKGTSVNSRFKESNSFSGVPAMLILGSLKVKLYVFVAEN